MYSINRNYKTFFYLTILVMYRGKRVVYTMKVRADLQEVTNREMNGHLKFRPVLTIHLIYEDIDYKKL